MKQQSNGELLLKTNLYLLQPGILVYWLALSFLSVFVVLYIQSNPDAEFFIPLLLGIKGAGYLILYYKIVDCMIAILAQQEKTSCKFNYTFTFGIAFRYALTLFLITWAGISLLPLTLKFYLSIFLFFISPAMLITIILKPRVIEMLNPTNWKIAIQYVSKSRYFSILYLPILIIIAIIFIGVFLSVGFFIEVDDNNQISREQVEFFSLLLQEFISPYFIALQMIYCAFIMRNSHLQIAELQALEKTINHMGKSDFERAEEAFSRGQYQETIHLLEPKIHINNNHLPTYLLLRQALLEINDNKSQEILKRLEFMMIVQAGLENDNFYTEILPQLKEVAKNNLDTLSPELNYSLIMMAMKHQDYPVVILLGEDFKTRFANDEKMIIEIGFNVAQSLDKTGRRQDSILMLQSLLEDYPEQQEMEKVKRAYQILTGEQ